MAAAINHELTHDELWDDSALQESWNSALAEYQKYHSMAARGEKVTVVTAPKSIPDLPSKAAAMLNGTNPPSRTQAKPDAAGVAPSNDLPGNFAAPDQGYKKPAVASAAAATSADLSGLPQALLAATSAAQDENLRSLMMSWYYAGYHTGFYEGQQKVLGQWQESVQQEQEQAEAGAEEGEGEG